MTPLIRKEVCVFERGVCQFILFTQHGSNFLLYIISDLIALIPCYIMSVAVTERELQTDKKQLEKN